MAVLSKGTTFANGDQVTAAKLNNLVDASTFVSGAVDNISTQLSGGGIIVKDGGVSTAKLADSAVTAIKIASDALTAAYPVGSIYMNASDATNPATLLGFGTWVVFGAGKVPVGIDAGDTDFDAAEETGGAKTHTLTIDEIPAHTHDSNMRVEDPSNVLVDTNLQITVANGQILDEENNNGTASTTTASTGGGNAHNNLQPYIVVYMWKRTA
jgi:hypothetical protein